MESDADFTAGQERVVFSLSRSERNDPANPSMFRMVLPSLGKNGDVYYTIDWSERRRLFPHSSCPNDDWVIGTIVTLQEQRELPELPNSILWRANLVPYGQLPAAMAPPVEEVWPEIDDDEWAGVQAAARERDRQEQAEQDALDARVNQDEFEAMIQGQERDRLQRGHQAAQPVQGGYYDWQAHIGARNPEQIALDDLWANIVANQEQLRPPPGYQERMNEPDDGMEQDGGGSRTRSKKSKKRRPTRRRRDRRGSSKRKGRNGRKSRKTRATRRR